MADDEEGQEKTTASSTETIAEALMLIRHLMADKVLDDEQTVLSDTGMASLIAADLDESLALAAVVETCKTLPLYEADKAAVNSKLKIQSATSTRVAFQRRLVYQPSTTAEDPDPMRQVAPHQDEPGLEEIADQKYFCINDLPIDNLHYYRDEGSLVISESQTRHLVNPRLDLGDDPSGGCAYLGKKMRK